MQHAYHAIESNRLLFLSDFGTLEDSCLVSLLAASAAHTVNEPPPPQPFFKVLFTCFSSGILRILSLVKLDFFPFGFVLILGNYFRVTSIASVSRVSAVASLCLLGASLVSSHLGGGFFVLLRMLKTVSLVHLPVMGRRASPRHLTSCFHLRLSVPSGGREVTSFLLSLLGT